MVARIYERIQNSANLVTECPANRSQSALNVSAFGKLGTNDARVSLFLKGKDGRNEMAAMEGSIPAVNPLGFVFGIGIST